jgi:hypothetical protein
MKLFYYFFFSSVSASECGSHPPPFFLFGLYFVLVSRVFICSVSESEADALIDRTLIAPSLDK